MGRLYGRLRPCTWRLHDPVHGTCRRPCTGRAHGRVHDTYAAAYTCLRVRAICTAENGRLHGRVTCRVYGRVRAVSARVHGSVRAVCTAVFGRVHWPCALIAQTARYSRVRPVTASPCRRTCTRLCMGRVHDRVHGALRDTAPRP